MARRMKAGKRLWSLPLMILVMVAGGVYLEMVVAAGSSATATAGGDQTTESVNEAAFQFKSVVENANRRMHAAFELLSLELGAQIEADINKALIGLPEL